MIVIDAGAHVGYYSLLAARRVGPAGKVYAFEPDPANYQLLLDNIELNGYSNITAVNAALSNQEGHSTLFLTTLDTGRHSLYRQDLPLKGSVDVPATTLDAFLAAEGWPNVGLVKVDVEGSEADLLDGMTRLLDRSSDIELIMEFNPSLLLTAGVDLHEFVDRFATWGLDVKWIDEKTGSISLEPVARDRMIGSLLSNEGSINLFCSRL
jgi:FkbM family methyltransferase